MIFRYCFAVLGVNEEEEEKAKIESKIGKTGEKIGCFHPLPINLLCSYLAKSAY